MDNIRKVLDDHKMWLAGLGGERANLSNTNLSNADLIGAHLSGADLRGTIIDHTTIGVPMACPETGSFHGWKKCKDKVLVKLRIPEDAKRSSAATTKCRADKVEVLEVLGADVGVSERGQIYEIGEIVVADSWDGNRWNECSHGIHFFVKRSDAELWFV